MTADDHPVHIGLSFPNFGQFADPAVLVDLARRADMQAGTGPLCGITSWWATEFRLPITG
jgi:hypothetical protein